MLISKNCKIVCCYAMYDVFVHLILGLVDVIRFMTLYAGDEVSALR